MRKTIVMTFAAAAALLAGCSSSDDEPAAATTTGPSSDALADVQADDVDVTAELTTGQPWAGVVTTATETEPGRVEILTTIVDPRGGTTDSPEAQRAMAICIGAVAWLQGQGVAEPKVSVQESNGTSFVLAGHPSYGPGCVEV